ncbi:dihydrolipoamide acetyltransferase family protein [Alicyclobacillus herbarius]|uniref:dihydrolipoamide acetyltransferase family protein n=1 Tax=Alicyclobacillus herbarius TaxID=122960 RepID=UPI0003F77CB8|nr:dihydrolipoamide acetyltransferase family protein [Alicyclobacillus herbarius]
MAVEFRLPDVGEGIHEAEIVRWLVHEGDRVEEFDPMVEVQTDKAIVELPAPVTGVVEQIYVSTGSIAHVGDVLVEIEPESIIGDPVVIRAPDPAPLTRDGRTADRRRPGPGVPGRKGSADDADAKPAVRDADATPSERRSRSQSADSNQASAGDREVDRNRSAGADAGRGVDESGAPRRPKATPGVRHFARAHGVSLWDVAGSGPGGRIRKSDVERYLQERAVRDKAKDETVPKQHVRDEQPVKPASGGAARSLSEKGTSLLWSLAQRPAGVRTGERDRREAGYSPLSARLHKGLADEDGPYRVRSQSRDATARAEADDAVRRPLGAVSRAASSEPRTPTRVPFRGIRRATAEHVKRSVFTAPHVTAFDECDATALVALRQRWNERLEPEGRRISYLPFIIKAVVSALRAFPYFNARLDEEAEEILLLPEYHIGIAVDTPDGLFVPVVRDADQLTVREIGEEIYRLSSGARNRTLTPQDLRGSTFTITNMGPIGGLFATPILNYPEVGILGIHQIQKKPVVIGDEIQIRQMMTMTLSFDHRVIDGAMSVRFMNHLKRLIEHPEELMLELR